VETFSKAEHGFAHLSRST